MDNSKVITEKKNIDIDLVRPFEVSVTAVVCRIKKKKTHIVIPK